ncbi:hypothetical protein NMS06_003183 [Vibrio cholerae]|nr:hypothetical protein [Vibrio cholerae]EJL6441839.1 hypothetical protein [Vibrio cholerae]
MKQNTAEKIGRLVKFLFLLLAIYTYYETNLLPLILIMITLIGIDELVISKRINNIERKLGITKD